MKNLEEEVKKEKKTNKFKAFLIKNSIPAYIAIGIIRDGEVLETGQ